MTFLRAIATQHHDSGLPEDKVVNVWHFDSDSVNTPAADGALIAGRLHTFYQVIDVDMSALLTNRLDVQVYDLSDAEPRIPVYEEFWTDMTRGPATLPEEVALCLSFQAEPASGQNQARRRGRVYLGPWGADTNVIVGNRARPLQVMVDALLTAADAMATGPGAGDPRLAVFSPTTLQVTAGDLDAAFNDVVEFWVDDAWDTMRKRGPKPGSRTVKVVS